MSARVDGSPEPQAAPPPSGTVSFLFTDIEGSTTRWERFPQAMAAAVRRHDEVMRASAARHRGHVFKTMGDAFYIAFHTVGNAVQAAYHAQTALAAEDFGDVEELRVRMAVHVGSVEARDGDYYGSALNKLARMLQAGHGEQILLTGGAAELLGDEACGFAVVHLGEHRLKDLQLPEHIYQLKAPGLREDFPPLRTVDARPNNLPLALTSFVGRDADVQTLCEQLNDARLITLFGTGGVGKTRLSLQVGSALLDRFPDGVWFIDLAPIESAALVAAEVLSTLGVPASPSAAATAAVTDFLSARCALLIFDNCEHLTVAVADLVASLLQRCPSVRMIVTSRQALGIQGERVHTVAALDVPAATIRDARAAAAYGSVQLFVDRARAQRNSFALDDGNAPIVAAICRHLDGIPLAIELAAARIAMLGPRALLDRLNERFKLLSHGSRTALPRQQTLRSLIDWSYDLLDGRERSVFRCLAVFSGGWTLESAGAVCSTDAYDEWDLFELVSSLVAKSLVTADAANGEQRFGFLESIKEYAAYRLREEGELAELERRHAHYFARFLEDNQSLWALESKDAAWKTAVAPDTDNVRAALTWTSAHEPELGLRILAALGRPEMLFLTSESLERYEAAAKALTPATPAIVKSRILRRLAYFRAEAREPIARREEAVQLALTAAREAGDAQEMASALIERALLYEHAGRYDEANDAFASAYELAETASVHILRRVLLAWAVNDLERGDLQRARDRFEECTELEPAGSQTRAFSFINLAEAEYALGRIERAQATALRAREQLIALGHPALAIVDCNLAAYAMAKDDLASASASLSEALGLVQDAGAAGALTTTLEHHALLAGLLGNHRVAGALLGFTERQYASAGQVRERTEQKGYERLISVLGAALDARELDRLLHAGAELPSEQATALCSSIHTMISEHVPAASSEERI